MNAAAPRQWSQKQDSISSTPLAGEGKRILSRKTPAKAYRAWSSRSLTPTVVLYEIVRWLFKLFNRLRLHEIRAFVGNMRIAWRICTKRENDTI